MITNGDTNISDPQQKNNFKKCQGDYCNLIQILDSNEDLFLNSHKSPLRKSIVQSQIQSRTRAYKILQRILTKKELLELEDTGEITRLKIAKRIKPNVYRSIPTSYVVAPRDQFRIAYLELQDAEEIGSSESIKVIEKDCRVENHRKSVSKEGSLEPMVQVCDMCYHTYKLFNQYKYLIDEKIRGEIKGSLESTFDELGTQHELGYIACKTFHDVPDLVSSLDVMKNDVNIKPNTISESISRKDAIGLKPLVKLKASSSSTRSIGPNPRVKVRDTEVKTFRVNDETTVTYTVLESMHTCTEYQSESKFNMIVCHDMFETLERFAIYFKQMLTRNGGHQILLWNYPGQAYTEFSEGQCLNNEFHSDCLRTLLQEIGSEGREEFSTNKPFYILGHGHGASIACTFAKSCVFAHLEALILINPLSYIDTHAASILHDCRNAFSCSPEERPDLPFYFYSRFLFSDYYLKKTTAPLALNLYTAVHNPITLRGRLRLCDGVLKNSDLRSIASEILPPIVAISGKDSVFVRPLHASTFAEKRKTCTSIQNLFHQKGKRSVLISMPGGHDLFQERRKDLSALIESLLKGSHESSGDCSEISYCVTPMHLWDQAVTGITSSKQPTPQRKASFGSSELQTKSNNTISKMERVLVDSSKPKEEPISVKSEKEYMCWRLKRNRKRLSRYQRAARIIQSSMRVFMAKTMMARLKRQISAITIQRCYRGVLGRYIFAEKQKEQWAARFVQRMYRGALGRRSSYNHRLCILAQIKISSCWRGFIDRKLVKQMVHGRKVAAIKLQSLWRRVQSCTIVRKMVFEQNAAIAIQSLFRGRCARLQAAAERKKYVFSLSQSRGIEIGRKLLNDHRIHASKLKSELSILDTKKVSLTKKVDEISKEMTRFELRAKELENEMHDISALEIRQKSTIYPSAKAAADIAVREKKIQLDQEFSVILTKICDRKNQLSSVENKVSQIESEILDKQEKLKELERKLVVLLEAQERELDCIKKTQEDKADQAVKGELQLPIETYSQPQSHLKTVSEINKAAKLYDSTENLMKFGFSSMAMTYFTSMNMVRAMKSLSLPGEPIHLTKNNQTGVDQTHEFQSNKGGLYSSVCKSTSLSSWTVDDVVEWLRVLSLRQYEDSFRDGAVDGPFLSQLTDDDLLNILGVEHKLHRKKILYGILKLMDSQTQSSPQNIISEYPPSSPSPSPLQINKTIDVMKNPASRQSVIASKTSDAIILPSMDDLIRSIRNNKHGVVKEALSVLEDGKFDPIDLRVQFQEGIGTVYKKYISDSVFHINQSDEHGNTLLHVAAQNGNMKIAKLLINKGSNPNHQNKQGQTPGHFAVSYQFYDFASWLFDEDGGGGDDLLVNIFGLGPYDGLSQSEL